MLEIIGEKICIDMDSVMCEEQKDLSLFDGN